MNSEPARVSLVVSTIGRPEQLERLLSSLEQIQKPSLVELILVDQTADQSSAQYLMHRNLPFQVQITTSARGLSIGRNAGLKLATAEFVAFPDDDCWYQPDTISLAARFLDANPDVSGVSGIQRTVDGRDSMLRWAPTGRWITRNNFYRTAISSTLFLRTADVRTVGGFDLTLGAGSTDGYMSGEESDLVLKLLETGNKLRYEPRLVVLQDEPRDDLPDGYVNKMAGYGRGFGRLFADHHLSKPLFCTLIGRKAVGGLVRTIRQDDLAAADRAFIQGAISAYRERSCPK